MQITERAYYRHGNVYPPLRKHPSSCSCKRMHTLQQVVPKGSSLADSPNSRVTPFQCRSAAAARPLLASSSISGSRSSVRTFAQVSKQENHDLVQFQPFDEVTDLVSLTTWLARQITYCFTVNLASSIVISHPGFLLLRSNQS